MVATEFASIQQELINGIFEEARPTTNPNRDRKTGHRLAKLIATARDRSPESQARINKIAKQFILRQETGSAPIFFLDDWKNGRFVAKVIAQARSRNSQNPGSWVSLDQMAKRLRVR